MFQLRRQLRGLHRRAQHGPLRPFSSSSAQGNVEFSLGVKYLRGKADDCKVGSSASVHGAVLHWTNAAEMGHVRAQAALGSLYLLGHGGISRNVKVASQLLQQAADAGHAGSCHEIGRLLFQGTDEVPRDLERALHYWKKAASSGHMAAS